MLDVFPALCDRFKGGKRVRDLGNVLLEGGDGEPIIANKHWAVTCESVSYERDTFESQAPVYDLVFELFGIHKTPDLVRKAMKAFRDRFHHADLQSADFHTVRCVVTAERGPFRRTDTKTYGGIMRVELWTQKRSPVPVFEET